MMLGSNQLLAAAGLDSLKYFTVLANLLEAAACFMFVLDHKKAGLFKFMGATSVTLTFLVVVVFLGPLFGYSFVFKGVNFWFHLVIPLLSVFEFVLMNQTEFDNTDKLYAISAMLLYGILYLANILINGLEGNDWYAFMIFGIPAGCLIMGIIILLTYFIAHILRELNIKYRL